MRCPYCATLEDKVVDSRLVREGRAIRRRRQCEACDKRYTTYEALEEFTPVVVKKDGRREAYSREKMLFSITHSLQKRPVSRGDVNAAVDGIEARLFEGGAPELPSHEIGEAVMDFLKRVDPIAYIRFASVYRSFNDLHEFLDEIQEFIGKDL